MFPELLISFLRSACLGIISSLMLIFSRRRIELNQPVVFLLYPGGNTRDHQIILRIASSLRISVLVCGLIRERSTASILRFLKFEPDRLEVKADPAEIVFLKQQ